MHPKSKIKKTEDAHLPREVIHSFGGIYIYREANDDTKQIKNNEGL